MSKFLYDSNLNSELENIIREAEEYIFLISPYIKLHPRIKSPLARSLPIQSSTHAGAMFQHRDIISLSALPTNARWAL
jgi:hypothetical protein